MTANNGAMQRIQSIDILRGLIMLIMALDHVRDFYHHAGVINDPTNLAQTTPILFFTRWITHFCAPAFVFLSGISVYLAGLRRTRKELSMFLIKRGLWLIFVEVAFITLALTCNPLYNVLVFQVIWVIGASMVLLGLLIWLPVTVIAAVGIILVFGHNLLDYADLPQKGAESVVMKILLTGVAAFYPIGNNHFVVFLYTLLPWTGLMFFGYVLGRIYNPAFGVSPRKRILLISGLSSLALFFALRLVNLYGDPSHWAVQKNSVFTFLSFINVSKYPPSLQYMLLTIGVALLFLAFTEDVHNRLTRVLTVYGSVPFFYYVLHFYFIRFGVIISFFAQGYKTSQIVTPNSPSLFTPPGAGYPLWFVYVVWVVLIVLLYFPCQWFAKYKKTHRQWWLSYL